MRATTLTFAALVLGGSVLTAAVLAEGDAETKPRIERAKAVVKSLDAIELDVTRTLAAVQTSGKEAPADLRERLGDLADALAETVKDARSLTKPITLAELTDAERESLTQELRNETTEPADNALRGWQQRAMERSLVGADLSEEQEIQASEIVGKWFKDAWDARKKGDSKRSSDLKRERNKALTKALGKKKARKVINNLDSLSNRWR